MVGIEFVLDEAANYACFAHAGVADKDEFEGVVVFARVVHCYIYLFLIINCRNRVTEGIRGSCCHFYVNLQNTFMKVCWGI